jgi:ribonuclease HepT-like protein
MPSDSPGNALNDIQRNIGLARRFVLGLSFEAFRADERTVYAVTRCLQIISEASRKEITGRADDSPGPGFLDLSLSTGRVSPAPAAGDSRPYIEA